VKSGLLLAFCLSLAVPGGGFLSAQIPRGTPPPPSPWGAVVEPDAPFFSSVLDARALGEGWPADNLTPRGLILNLGHGYWACFDTDLLRVAAIWSGTGVTPAGMAQGSYHLSGAKAPEGQGSLPRIAGTALMANGLYPGWQTGSAPLTRVDPRPVGPDPRELGRGPIDPAIGRFRGVRLTAEGVALEYDAQGSAIQERIVARVDNGRAVIERRVRMITPSSSVPPRPVDGIVTASSGIPLEVRVDAMTSVAAPPPVRWPQVVTTRAALAPSTSAFVVDRIPLPVNNPWRRNVRVADIAFLGDGRAAAVTFDGDVWTIEGLDGDLQAVTWRRFASGLHEPLSLTVRNGEIFVFDRNGIWRLHDTDRNGEADWHELFANGFVQTAETREFAMSLRVAPDGSFVIAKGGQEGTTIGRDNGSVLRISADGRTVTKLGYGLRQPFASVDPKTGRVIASDQQGNYVPSTPLHEIRDGQYYGFIPLILPKEQYPAPIADPIAWIPHSISPSAAGQVWLRGSRMGPLDDALVLLSYYRPELFVVRLPSTALRAGPSTPLGAAVASLSRDLTFAPLAGAVNPADGQMYVTGFQIWGSDAKDVSGLARVRYTGAPSTLPRDVVPMNTGVLLRFDVALDRTVALDPANYSAERWNYRRTADYGSPHFTLDGRKGQDGMIPTSAYLSGDGKAVFVGLPDMQPVMQMRVGWSLKTQAGQAFQQNTYLTPHALARFDPVAEGFDPVAVDLRPRAARVTPRAAPPAEKLTAADGQRIVARMGCVGCHSTDGTAIGRIGPSWKGLANTDAEYLRESIVDPSAKVTRGFDQSVAGMPSYAGVLTAAEIDAVIAYIQTLK
jgi:mono/diheme cytochrome c family protein